MPTLGQITALLDEWYPPHHADDWDAVGLVCGDPATEVRRILLAVDPVEAVAAEAIELGAGSWSATTRCSSRVCTASLRPLPKGRTVHRLTTAGCGLFTAHTNADSPNQGVSESLALALGLLDVRPLEADAAAPMDKIVVFVPVDAAERVREALAQAGAGALGDYEACTFSAPGEGRFRPLPGAQPTIGEVGRAEVVEEVRVETVCPRHLREAAVAAIRSAHPYEEPAFDVLEMASLDEPARGSGRIGRLSAPESLSEFAARVAEALPWTAHGVRVAGDPDQRIETVGLCGGSGDFLLDRARSAGADVYLTSDLRHHPASESREHGSMALVDVAHYAAESTWLPVLRRRLQAALDDTVEVRTSKINTDPWTFRV